MYYLKWDDADRWVIPEVCYLDARTRDSRELAEAVRAGESPDGIIHYRTISWFWSTKYYHFIIDGQLFSCTMDAPLKRMILEQALQQQWSAQKTLKALRMRIWAKRELVRSFEEEEVSE